METLSAQQLYEQNVNYFYRNRFGLTRDQYLIVHANVPHPDEPKPPVGVRRVPIPEPSPTFGQTTIDVIAGPQLDDRNVRITHPKLVELYYLSGARAQNALSYNVINSLIEKKLLELRFFNPFFQDMPLLTYAPPPMERFSQNKWLIRQTRMTTEMYNLMLGSPVAVILGIYGGPRGPQLLQMSGEEILELLKSRLSIEGSKYSILESQKGQKETLTQSLELKPELDQMIWTIRLDVSQLFKKYLRDIKQYLAKKRLDMPKNPGPQILRYTFRIGCDVDSHRKKTEDMSSYLRPVTTSLLFGYFQCNWTASDPDKSGKVTYSLMEKDPLIIKMAFADWIDSSIQKVDLANLFLLDDSPEFTSKTTAAKTTHYLRLTMHNFSAILAAVAGFKLTHLSRAYRLPVNVGIGNLSTTNLYGWLKSMEILFKAWVKREWENVPAQSYITKEEFDRYKNQAFAHLCYLRILATVSNLGELSNYIKGPLEKQTIIRYWETHPIEHWPKAIRFLSAKELEYVTRTRISGATLRTAMNDMSNLSLTTIALAWAFEQMCKEVVFVITVKGVDLTKFVKFKLAASSELGLEPVGVEHTAPIEMRPNVEVFGVTTQKFYEDASIRMETKHDLVLPMGLPLNRTEILRKPNPEDLPRPIQMVKLKMENLFFFSTSYQLDLRDNVVGMDMTIPAVCFLLINALYASAYLS